jgi:hypothetical protein
VVATADTASSAGCEPSHAVVLSRARISTDTSAPCVLGLLGSHEAEQDRTYGGDH